MAFIALVLGMISVFTALFSLIRVRDVNKFSLSLGSITFMWVFSLCILSGVNTAVVLVLGLPLGSVAAVAIVRVIPFMYRQMLRRSPMTASRVRPSHPHISSLQTSVIGLATSRAGEDLEDLPLSLNDTVALKRRISTESVSDPLLSHDLEELE